MLVCSIAENNKCRYNVRSECNGKVVDCSTYTTAPYKPEPKPVAKKVAPVAQPKPAKKKSAKYAKGLKFKGV